MFVKAQAGQYGIVVAMYHDQGHIPLKLAGFKLDLKTNKYTAMSGVNSTIGLPIIRQMFQSTLPRGERPTSGKLRHSLKPFQSTLPRGERRQGNAPVWIGIRRFNPRSRVGSDSS